ncbi:TPA_asm: L [Garlic alphacytorhabdovirus 1]|nr:TPA_asm: L [Garlic alphacytorhabdovirus 1]
MNFFDEPDRDASIRKNKFDPLPDYHLQNPLYSIKDYIDKQSSKARLPRRIKESFKSLKKLSLPIVEGCPHELLRVIKNIDIDKDIDKISDTLDDCIHRINLECSNKDKIDPSDLNTSLQLLRQRFPLSLWNPMRHIQEFLIVLNALSSRRPLPSGYERSPSGFVSRRLNGIHFLITEAFFCYIDKNTNNIRVHAGDWLRSVSDVCTERFLVYIGAIMGHVINPYHYPKTEDVISIIDWGDSVIKTFGNNGFKILKAFEAICLGVLQERSEGNFVDRSLFLNNTLTDLRAESLAYGAYADELVAILRRIPQMHHLTQIYGLHRIWGHPLVDASKGMEKMILIGQKDIMVEGELPTVIGAHFKKMMCGAYKSKHGIYPNIVYQGDTLSRFIIDNEEWNVVNQPSLDEDWKNLVFDKTFMIPESFNLSMIVADKSVSPTRSELKENILSKGTVMNQELRRGVLRWINNDSLDPREFLTQVNEDKFPDDHRIIGMRSKERELNPTPRMFSLMSHLMRIYVVITESMLSDHILPYFPQITMVDSLLDLTKKMYTSVKSQASSNRKIKHGKYDNKTVCMSLDFEKWNGHMRKESTLNVFTALGELFGMSDLYNQTYDIFRSSYFYIADGSYVPRINKDGDFVPEPPYSFTDHKGGQEGLRQKGWTIFTVVVLDWICIKHNCTFKIMGMGDNQVLLLTFYTSKTDNCGRATETGLRDMQRCLNGLFQDLIETFGLLGLPLKPLETWISEDLFVYGKYPIWRGVPMSMDLKKIMRIFPFSNLEIMTVENILNTIAGNSQAASQSAPHLGIAYIIGLFMGFLCCADLLSYHPLIGKGLLDTLKDSREWGLKFKGGDPIVTQILNPAPSLLLLRRLLLSVPRVMGGYVSLNLFSNLMRGFPDPVSLSASVLYHWGLLCPIQTDPFLQYLRRWLTPLYMPERSMKLLVEDVASINLLAPVTPTAGLRQAVESYLQDGRVIKNIEFRDLMTTRDPDLEEVIANHLCSGDQLHIRLIHDIMEATIYGYIKSIISKVTKSSTIVSLAVGKAKGNPLNRVLKDEENYFRFFVWRCLIEPEYTLPLCPTNLAKQMRREGWGKELVGVTVAFPWSYLSKTECHQNERGCDCPDGYISLFLPDVSVSVKDWNTSIGKCPPYLGSMTKEKVVISSGSKIYSSEPLIRRPINLMRVIGWFVPDDSEIAKIIRACVTAVSDIDSSQFQGIVEGTSGSEIHRFKDSSLKHGALCSSNFLFSTRYHISTDTFSRYAKGSQNFDMMFQANLCAILESMHLSVVQVNQVGDVLPKSHHYKQVCYECINPLDEEFHDVENSRVATLIPTKKTNRYLYVPNDRVSMVKEITPWITWVTQTLSKEEFDQMSNEDKLWWLTDCVVDNICIDILGYGGEESYMTTSLMDIKEHNRLFYLTVNPKDVYLALCGRIRMMAEWRCISKSDWKVPTPESVKRASLAIIGDTPISKWSGLTGFFSWPSSMQKYYFAPEILEPDTIPVTTASACRAIKHSLVGLLNSHKVFPSRKSMLIPEDQKSSKTVLKLMLYDRVSKTTNCLACKRAVGILSTHKLALSGPSKIYCAQGHQPFHNYKQKTIRKSRVTLDALRKECQPVEETLAPIVSPPSIRPLYNTSCVELLNTNELKAEWIRFHKTGLQDELIVRPIETADLYKILSLPTNAQYKYLELFSFLHFEMNACKRCLLTGNGLGGTSHILMETWKGKAWLSTLLDTEESIPQVYPHCNKMFKSLSHPRLRSDDMVININDITHPNWGKDWNKVVKSNEIDFVISDIEITGLENNKSRDNAIDKMLELNQWKLAIIKDYIYTISEFEERLALISEFTKDIRIITCNSRQRVMPEVWWVCKNVTPKTGISLGFHRSVIRLLWGTFTYDINTAAWDLPEIMQSMNNILVGPDELLTMMTRVRAWASLPIVGDCLPYKGSYTRLIGYLQRGKRPLDISLVRDNADRKLYMSDYFQVRNVLFGMAVSMVAPIDIRERMLKESKHWTLDWKPSSSKTWLPFLLYDPDSDYPDIHVYDYIPVLSIHMRKENLLFKTVKNIIEFKNQKERDILCFPISKSSYIKLQI